MYFEDAEYNDTDKHFNPTTMVRGLVTKTRGKAVWAEGTFDVVVPRTATA